MNKSLIFLALVAANGLAFAQSSLTIGGGVDNAFARGTGSIASRNRLVSNAGGASKLWFIGKEDLGGGLSANFYLDASVNTDEGTGQSSNSNNQASGTSTAPAGTQGLTFNRRSTVGLAGPWGEINMGRDQSAQYKGRYEIDPSGNNGVFTVQTQAGSLAGPTGVRVSNFIGYALPAKAGGFYGLAQYYFGENASNAGPTAKDGRGAAARLGYATGPLDVQAATAFTHFDQSASTGSIRSSNVTLRYMLGNVKLMTGYFIDRVNSTTPVTGKGGALGAIWYVGPNELKAALSQYRTNAGTHPGTTKLSLGYVYNFSKRTAFFTQYAHATNYGGATTALNASVTGPNQGSSGFDVGLRHSF